MMGSSAITYSIFLSVVYTVPFLRLAKHVITFHNYSSVAL